MRNRLALAYLVLTGLFLLAVLGQVFLAGLALFWRDSLWQIHTGLGHLAPVFPFAMLILALVGKLPVKLRPYTSLLLVGVLVQTEVFAGLRQVSGLGSSYHPVLAVLLFWGGTVLARRSFVLVTTAHGKIVQVAGASERRVLPITCDPQVESCA